jgi:DNA-directed RNA polymerase specialized sigma24 family protein
MQISNTDNPEQAFMRAFEKFSNRVFGLCYEQLANRKQAIEITEDIFRKMWDYIAEGNVIADAEPFLRARAAQSCFAAKQELEFEQTKIGVHRQLSSVS